MPEVSRLFFLACDVAPAEREAFVRRAASGDEELVNEVLELLAADASGFDDLGTLLPTHPALPDPARLASEIGGYRILSVLGSGGMGVVYRARQLQPERDVALKVLLPGADVAQLGPRLEREAELLARLSHPGIARIFASGTADVRGSACPFFVMELVEGRPITDHVRDARLGPPDIARLLVRICDAVQHAHDHGVIHRDLKPGNVLVDRSGAPRVLDFGFARTSVVGPGSAPLTQDGMLVGTLAYMSPEQARRHSGDVDERSDVYSIGAMAYELFTRRLPVDVGRLPLAEAVRRIVHDDPVPMGSIDRHLAGDLEVIVGKALAKEPGRRYATAAELRADLERWLGHEPVVARAPSTLYRASRFVQRHRALVGTSAVLVVASLVTAAVALRAARVERDAAAVAFDALEEARTERARAERALLRARTVSELLETAIERANPFHATEWAADASLSDMLAGLDAELSTAPPADPAVEVEARLALARSFKGLGRYTDALAQAELAARRLPELSGDEVDLREGVHAEIAVAHGRLGQWERAVVGLEDSLARREAAGASAAVLGPLLGDLAWARLGAGNQEGAETASRRALDLAIATEDPDDELIASLTTNLGKALSQAGRVAEARDQYAAAMSAFDRLYPGDHVQPAVAANNLGWTEFRLGETDAALRHLRDAVERFRGAHPEPHPLCADFENNLAIVLHADGETDEAFRALRSALAAYRATRGESHADTEGALRGMAVLLGSQSRWEEASVQYADHADLLAAEGAVPDARIAGAEIESARLLAKDPERRAEAEGRLLAIAQARSAEVEAELASALVELYEADGREQSAAVWRTRTGASGPR